MSDRLDAYLTQLASHLPEGVDRRRILDEARDHLIESSAHHASHCPTPDAAIVRAIADFGTARDIARQFDARPRWRQIGDRVRQLTLRRNAVTQTRERTCSFCGKYQSQVKRMIAGPNDVQICSECVALCNDIISRHEASGQPDAAPA